MDFLQCQFVVETLRFEQRRSETIDLQSTPDTVTGLDLHDISLADALFVIPQHALQLITVY